MSKRTKFIYGPVPSRRLGYSLGVDLLPYKTCSLDCIYCQLGASSRKTVRRKEFIDPAIILSQIRAAVASGVRIDHITFSGSGEPTLSRSLGALIRGIKKMTDIPVAVLTNGTLLHRKDVRRSLLEADVVVPSLDAATGGLFRRINRPHPSLSLDKMIRGLREFRREFKGEIWIEIMLIKGINDSPAHVRQLRKILETVRPDKIQLNTVVRPPAEKQARPLDSKGIGRIRKALGGVCEAAPAAPGKKQVLAAADISGSILATVRRRPVTAADIASSLGRRITEVRKALAALITKKRIRRRSHGGKVFYEPMSS
jgi:wyosine [tRNA(Phe)-imidazoG37] synthetase (radical SAM superfamily)